MQPPQERPQIIRGTTQPTLLGKYGGTYEVYSAKDAAEFLPLSAVLAGQSAEDLAALRARLQYLKDLETESGERLFVSLVFSKIVSHVAGGLSTTKLEVGEIIVSRPNPFAKGGYEYQVLTGEGKFVRGPNWQRLGATGLLGAAELGTIGLAAQYIAANDRIDAQATLLKELETKLGNEDFNAFLQLVSRTFKLDDAEETISTNPDGKPKEDGTGRATLQTRRMWGKDP